jgi:hypothetical protein
MFIKFHEAPAALYQNHSSPTSPFYTEVTPSDIRPETAFVFKPALRPADKPAAVFP